LDADAAITIAFCFEAFLVAVAGSVVAVHEARKDHAEAVREPARSSPPGRAVSDRRREMKRRTGGRSDLNSFALPLGSLTALLAVAGVVTAIGIRPPTLGWLGFVIVSFVLLGLGALATLIVPRLRVSPGRPAVARDEQRRLLVVADPDCVPTALCDEIESHREGFAAVHVVVPIRVSRLHFLADDESEERRHAERATSSAIAQLRQRGIAATGSVGSDKPLESMTDALGAFPATEVLLATPPEGEDYWLERDLPGKARALIRLPVVHAVVPSTNSDRTGVAPIEAPRARAS